MHPNDWSAEGSADTRRSLKLLAAAILKDGAQLPSLVKDVNFIVNGGKTSKVA